MQVPGMDIDVRMFNMAISAYGGKGKWNDARRLLDAGPVLFKVSPDRISYTTVMQGMINARNPEYEMAVHISDQARSSGTTPTLVPK